nr:unnamed protein product [Callosobruchus chinensis]
MKEMSLHEKGGCGAESSKYFLFPQEFHLEESWPEWTLLVHSAGPKPRKRGRVGSHTFVKQHTHKTHRETQHIDTSQARQRDQTPRPLRYPVVYSRLFAKIPRLVPNSVKLELKAGNHIERDFPHTGFIQDSKLDNDNSAKKAHQQSLIAQIFRFIKKGTGILGFHLPSSYEISMKHQHISRDKPPVGLRLVIFSFLLRFFGENSAGEKDDGDNREPFHVWFLKLEEMMAYLYLRKGIKEVKETKGLNVWKKKKKKEDMLYCIE